MTLLSGLATPFQGLEFKSGIRGTIKEAGSVVINSYESPTYRSHRVVCTRELAGGVCGDYCICTQTFRKFELGFDQSLPSRFTKPFLCVRTYLGFLRFEPRCILPRIRILFPRLVLDHIEPRHLGCQSAVQKSYGKLKLRRGETILCRLTEPFQRSRLVLLLAKCAPFVTEPKQILRAGVAGRCPAKNDFIESIRFDNRKARVQEYGKAMCG